MVPVGTILPYGGNVLDARVIDRLKDSGWLVCDGRVVERSNYDELFDVIGVAFGAGDGKTTFNLPDLRGRFVRGVDVEDQNKDWRDPDHDTRSESASGGNKGNKVGSVQEDALLEHTHDYALLEHTHDYKTNTWYWKESEGEKKPYKYIRGNHLTDSLHTDKTKPSAKDKGKTSPGLSKDKKETRPKNIYVNFIIRAK